MAIFSPCVLYVSQTKYRPLISNSRQAFLEEIGNSSNFLEAIDQSQETLGCVLDSTISSYGTIILVLHSEHVERIISNQETLDLLDYLNYI